MSTTPAQLWKPLPSSGFHIKRFIETLRAKHGAKITEGNWDSLWQWSIDPGNAPTFWLELFDYLELKASVRPTVAMIKNAEGSMYPPPEFFPGARMNFAENIFANYRKNQVVLHVASEASDRVRDVTWDELKDQVSRLAGAMVASGVKEHDRVAAVISNRAETIAVCLAAQSLGAIFSCSSPDMGVDGVLSRLLQIRPKLVFCEDEVAYNGKLRDLMPKHAQWAEVMSKDAELENVVVIAGSAKVPTNLPKMITWDTFVARDKGRPLSFKQLPFSHPAMIVYSSGTSGPPKCIMHSGGGMLLQVKKDSFFSYDLRPGDTVLQYTTTGWIMWAMVLASAAFGGRVVLYDGSPFIPDALVLLRLVERLRVNVFGTSAKFLSMLMASGIKPKEQVDLSSLRTITSTGSTLTAQVATWFYEEGFPPNIHIVSTCGGTDIACSLMSGAATEPLHAGEIQAATLGMAVDLFDEDGHSIRESGQPGELVCTQPFPSQPVAFWGDKGGAKYESSYFEKFGRGVWSQGDFVSRNPATGGYLTHGRSDGVLNPAGIRFGSAEIYNVVDEDPEVGDGLCVGQRRPSDNDESVVLFVQMAPGHKYGPAVVDRLKAAIRQKLSPRHVPRYVFETHDIPHTINGKKVEILVKKLISGEDPKVSPTVANPECLGFYKQFVGIEEQDKQQERGWNKAKL